MAKESGIGDRLFIAGYDLSGDVGAINTLRASRAALDVTAIDKDAHERILGLADGEISFNTWFDTATDAEHAALSSLPTTDRVALYCRGTTLGNAAAGLSGKQINYDWDRGADGSLAGKVQVLGNGAPLEWGIQLTTGKQTIASAASGTAIDNTASTAFGAIGYLEAFSIGSGTANVAIQHSSDNISFANLISFTAVTARAAERVATATTTTTVNRYVRLNVTGTFTNLVLAVALVRFPVAQS